MDTDNARRIIIFGTGSSGGRAFETLAPTETIVAFADNDAAKVGKEFCGHLVLSPREILKTPHDVVRIASWAVPEIYSQLVELGISEHSIEIDMAPPDAELHEQWRREHSSAIKAFKDRHLGQDCFIVGNGPSLKGMDLSMLNGKASFGLNKIHLLFDRSSFRPTYHVSVNPYVIEQSLDDFGAMPCPSFLSYAHARGLASGAKNIRMLHTSHSHAFSQDAAYTICEGCTVTYVAMQLAFYMGFRNVYLIGVDHSFVAQGEPNETQTLEGKDLNHFDSRYFADQKWQLPDLEGSAYAYGLAKKAFAKASQPRAIWDATVNGKLNVFPKISYEDALRACCSA